MSGVFYASSTAISYIGANAVDSYWGERGGLTDANAWNDAKIRSSAFISLELWIVSSPASGKPTGSAEGGPRDRIRRFLRSSNFVDKWMPCDKKTYLNSFIVRRFPKKTRTRRSISRATAIFGRVSSRQLTNCFRVHRIFKS